MCGNDRIGSKQADWGSTAAAIRAMNALQSACDRGFKALNFWFFSFKRKERSLPGEGKKQRAPAATEQKKSPRGERASAASAHKLNLPFLYPKYFILSLRQHA